MAAAEGLAGLALIAWRPEVASPSITSSRPSRAFTTPWGRLSASLSTNCNGSYYYYRTPR